MDRHTILEIAARFFSGRYKEPLRRPVSQSVSFGVDPASAEKRRSRVQAKWDQRRLLRITAPATGPTRRQGRL